MYLYIEISKYHSRIISYTHSTPHVPKRSLPDDVERMCRRAEERLRQHEHTVNEGKGKSLSPEKVSALSAFLASARHFRGEDFEA